MDRFFVFVQTAQVIVKLRGRRDVMSDKAKANMTQMLYVPQNSINTDRKCTAAHTPVHLVPAHWRSQLDLLVHFVRGRPFDFPKTMRCGNSAWAMPAHAL
jgi:hypothetical protein